MSRGYQDALQKLTQLQSNLAITQLFNKATPTGSTSKSTRDLNAAAIPEMLHWLERAGYSPRDLAKMRHIHVAGTKGKGSVCAYATSVLCRYGTVGTYTSPHLVSPRERIAINGEAVSQEMFSKAFFELWDRFTEVARKEGMDAARAEGPESKPFFFRFMTIMAWHIFLQQGIRSVVVECGIGGEFDATNVLPPEAVSAAVIAQLGIDHVAMLGDTVEKIAWHKAGVMKCGVKAFTVNIPQQGGAMEVLRARAVEKEATLVEVDYDDIQSWEGVAGNLKGDFQKMNQVLALLAVREHLGMRNNIDGEGTAVAGALKNIPGEMINGLQEASLRGRCEVVHNQDATWLLDGAHTKDSLDVVAQWLAQSIQPGESIVLVFNQQERDVCVLLTDFVEAVQRETGREDVFRHALFTRNDQTKAAWTAGQTVNMSAQEAAATAMNKLVPACQTAVFDNIEEAVAEAKRLTAEQDESKVLVTGSLYLVGGILRALEPDGLL